MSEPIPQASRQYPNQLSNRERELIRERIQHGWDRNHSVDESFHEGLEQGWMLGSRSTWWRIAARMEQEQRPTVLTKPQSKKRTRTMPVLVAHGRREVLSWDITDLRGPYSHQCFKAFSVIDIFTREIVGYSVQERESARAAVEMFTDVFARDGAPRVVHADNGASMTSDLLGDLFESRGVLKTHNRPYVSNDNPYSESEFRTMKYRPEYPGHFASLEQARTFMDKYVHWYNNEHHHSGLAYFTPAQIGDGSWEQAWAQRDEAVQEYYEQHPERFTRGQPTVAVPSTVVGINHTNQQLQAA